jgi:hypothetical protein
MPNQRPNEPIVPATIPGQPLDPKIPPDRQADSEDPGTGERENEMLSATLHRVPSDASSDREESGNAQFGAVPGAELKIPDRSNEPAVQESLDPEQSTTAANSSDVPAEARDDEGNVDEVEAGRDEAAGAARHDADAGSQ